MSFSDANISDYENLSSSCDSDDECYLPFYSKNKKNNIDYFELDICCFETSDTICTHYIVIHYINGDTTNNRLDNLTIKKLLSEHDLLDEITNHEIFSHIIH